MFVPGRIEVLGKHTDYAGGSSIVAATEQGFCLVAWPREDDWIHVTEASTAETIGFQLDPQIVPRTGHWANYPMTVARRVARNFPQARRGADIAFASDLPPAAGMSSSSAMVVAVFFALDHANRLSEHREYPESLADPVRLAGYLATIENGQSFGSLEGDRGVGTFGGSEDHTAILCAEPNQLSQFRYCPVQFERATAMPSGCTLAVGVSGVVAEKTGAAREKYNRASRLASALVELWRRGTGRDDPHLAAALASSPDAAERFREIVQAGGHDEFQGAVLLARLEHFIVENDEVVPAAGRALAERDLPTFGRLVDRSQQAAERLLGNQVPQTSCLAAAARHNGAVAASAFGAGFGGSVWAMVETARLDRFLASWADAYRREFPRDAESASFFATAAGPAAVELPLA
ncbi:MAG: hypothetical protein A2V70_16530 [Planctomycetes bacterium RBG_13_63_9]|nr:MAG: hypothetical protein A2V70_16530 [Planctomycetes bacterium RBG_13_63_9]